MSAEDDVDELAAALLDAEPVDAREDRETLDDTDDLADYDERRVFKTVATDALEEVSR